MITSLLMQTGKAVVEKKERRLAREQLLLMKRY